MYQLRTLRQAIKLPRNQQKKLKLRHAKAKSPSSHSLLRPLALNLRARNPLLPLRLIQGSNCHRIHEFLTRQPHQKRPRRLRNLDAFLMFPDARNQIELLSAVPICAPNHRCQVARSVEMMVGCRRALISWMLDETGSQTSLEAADSVIMNIADRSSSLDQKAEATVV